MKKWIFIGLGALVLAIAAAAFGIWLWFDRWADTPMDGNPEVRAVDIPRGAGPLQVARLLEQQRIIDDATTFYRWLRYFRRAAGQLKAGELAFRGDMTPREVLRVLQDGTPVTHKVTVPEGLRIDEVAALFADEGLADAAEFERHARDPALARELGVPHDSLEGFLFPETYQFRKNASLDEILRTLVAGSRQVFTDDWRQQAEVLGLSELQVFTLASIVEKETGAPAERGLIAGVFHNRLKKGWKLQTDPTVIYAEILAKGRYDGTIHKSDLERDHPYNTYRYPGLPPGPICSPGAAALQAALFPTATDYMYFVSKNNGTHQFCATLACHSKWVEVYQRGGEP